MKNLVIGNKGQIGSAIEKVLFDKYNVSGIDIGDELDETFDVIHICIPGNLDNFIEEVKKYQSRYLSANGLTIIHSTVPIGTSRKVKAVHSPVRGVHPDLEEGVRKFEKFFGGERAEEAAKIFSNIGITCITTEKPENTEAMKLWSTTQYGLNIILEKEIKRFCNENDLDFDIVYSKANRTYNDGYEKLGKPQFKKYILKHMSGNLGGHCVRQNADLFNSWVCDIIKEKDEELKMI